MSEEGIVLDEATPELGEGEYFLAEGIKGSGDMPEYYDSERFTSVSEQARSYLELEKKFGSFTGSPKDGYDNPEGFESDDALVVALTDFASESHMSQDGFNKAFELLTAQSTASEEISQEAEMGKLGDTAGQRIKHVEGYLKNNLDDETYDRLKGSVNTAEAVELVEKLIGLSAPSKLPSQGGENPEGMTKDKLEELQFAKDEHGNPKMQDPVYAKNWRSLMTKFYGDGDYEQVVG